MDKDVIIRIEPDCGAFLQYPMVQGDDLPDNVKMAFAMTQLTIPGNEDLLEQCYRRAVQNLQQMADEITKGIDG